MGLQELELDGCEFTEIVWLKYTYHRGSLAALIEMMTSPCWEVLFLLCDDCETVEVLDLLAVTLVNQIEDPAAVATEHRRPPIHGHLFPAERPPCPLLLSPGAPCCSIASPPASVAEPVVRSL